MNQTDKMLQLCQIYADRKGLRLSTVALYCSNDGKFIQRLRSNKTVTVSRLERVTQWFSDHWPEDLAWPAGIERPAPHSTTPNKKEVA